MSRFGVHLIQVVDRRQVTLDAKQQREQARNVLREQKFEEAYDEWAARAARPRLRRDARTAAVGRPASWRRRRKRFGQHFLTDTAVIDAIVRAIDSAAGRGLVEIGPGLGALTDAAGRALRRADRRSSSTATWRRGCASGPASRSIEADVLKVDFAALAAARGRSKLRVVGNLPYNISTPILFHLLDAVDHVEDQHFMLQKEVVDRMAAAPGPQGLRAPERDAAVALRHRVAARRAARGLRPAAAGGLGRRAHAAAARAAGVDAALLGELVAVAFSQRRKLLRHTLGRWLDEQRLQRPTSTCSAAPKKCRWPNTWRWPRAAVPSLRRNEGAALRAALRMAVAALRRRCGSRSGRVQPHRGVECAAHQRHVHAEAVFAAVFAPPCGLARASSLLSLGATSVARSHDPISWERATEKNRNT